MAVDVALAEVRDTARNIHDATARHEDRIVAAYRAGASMKAIAEATVIDGNGVGQYTEEGVRQLLLRYGIEIRPRGRPASTSPRGRPAGE